jgi:hypothetical protein
MFVGTDKNGGTNNSDPCTDSATALSTIWFWRSDGVNGIPMWIFFGGWTISIMRLGADISGESSMPGSWEMDRILTQEASHENTEI